MTGRKPADSTATPYEKPNFAHFSPLQTGPGACAGPSRWHLRFLCPDRILKSTPPGELPLEQPARSYTTINLTGAKALGLTLPPSLLLHATEHARGHLDHAHPVDEPARIVAMRVDGVTGMDAAEDLVFEQAAGDEGLRPRGVGR